MKGPGIFQTNGLLDSTPEAHETFKQNGLLGGEIVTDSLLHSSVSPFDSRSTQASNPKETLEESQGGFSCSSTAFRSYND